MVQVIGGKIIKKARGSSYRGFELPRVKLQ